MSSIEETTTTSASIAANDPVKTTTAEVNEVKTETPLVSNPFASLTSPAPASNSNAKEEEGEGEDNEVRDTHI
jgi:hypothetical protein